MKKLIQLLTLNLFVLMLVTGCTGTTKLGFDGRDDDDDFATLSEGLGAQLLAELGIPSTIGGNVAYQFFTEVIKQHRNNGKTRPWACAYAKAIVEGRQPQEAQAHATQTHEQYDGTYWDNYQRYLNSKNDPERADKYADTIMRMRSATTDTEYTHDRPKEDEFLRHFAQAMGSDKDEEWAFHYAVARVEKKKDKHWSNVYADAMLLMDNPKTSVRLADICMLLRVDLKIPKKQAYQEAVRIIKQQGGRFNINYQDDENEDTYLIRAVRDGNIEAVQKLLACTGIDTTLYNKQRQTALMVAAEAGNVPMVALILNATGGKFADRKINKKTARTWANEGKKKAKKERRDQEPYKVIYNELKKAGYDETGLRGWAERNLPQTLTQAVGFAATVAALATL